MALVLLQVMKMKNIGGAKRACMGHDHVDNFV
jgi:hypothetical protein